MTTPAAADKLDPAGIRDRLPEPYRETFLREYHEAARAAADDPDRYRELRWMLHTWRLRSLRHADPDFERRSREAADPPPGAFLSAREVMPELDARLREHG